MVDDSVRMQKQVPAVQVARKTVDVPQTQFIDREMVIPVVQQKPSANGSDNLEDPGESTSAALGQGCQHACCGATPGAHGSVCTENTQGTAVAAHLNFSPAIEWKCGQLVEVQ